MQKKTIFFVVAFLCLVMAGYLYYLYQKPRTGVSGVEADYTIAANLLYEAFVKDEPAASNRYIDKVLEVKGRVEQIDTLNGKNVLLGSSNENGGVNCSLSEDSPVPTLGSEVIIKGRCTGFLLDVSLVDGVLEK